MNQQPLSASSSTRPESLGQRLYRQRLLLGLSQEALAEELGVSARSIRRWEQDQAIPQKTVRQRLCRVFGKDACSLFGTWQREDTPSVTISFWQIPFPRNPFFTGRTALLETLHERLSPSHPAVLPRSYALCGLGGMGKTHLAVEYAYRYAEEYQAIFWIGAESVERIISDFLRIAEHLQLPEQHEADQHRIVTAVHRWLTSRRRWLLIWDNVEDLDLVRRFLPSSPQGSMVLTTRQSALGTLAQPLELLPMTPEEGLLLLFRRARVLPVDASAEHLNQLAGNRATDYAAAQELVTTVGGLPLALDQIGAYIEETGCSLADYLQYFHRHRARLLNRRGLSAGDHPHSVAQTFLFAFQRVEQQHPAAADLIRLCVFLHPDAIPEEIFTQGASHLGSPLASIAQDSLAQDGALATLRTFALLHRRPAEKLCSVHRLVQNVLLDALEEEQRQIWAQRALLAVNAAFPVVKDDSWPQCERLVSHALQIAKHTASKKQVPLELATLLLKAGAYLTERARYQEAGPVLQRAFQIREQALGADHADVAEVLRAQAFLHDEQGQYRQAEPLYQRALEIWEHLLGKDHPTVVRTLNALGVIYRAQGRYEQARPLHYRALHVQERTLGTEHPDVAQTLQNLGMLFYRMGQMEQAETAYQRAFHIREQALGPEHPDVANSLNNLALIAKDQGKEEQAEALYQKALHIEERAFGSEDLRVGRTLNNLAELYTQQGRGEQAESLFYRVIHLWEKVLGPHHPNVAYPLHGLATLYANQGRNEQAEELFQRALRIWEQSHGPDHPDVAHALDGLAGIAAKQGELEQAESLCLQALSIREHACGAEHPLVADSLAQLAQLADGQKQYEQAEALYERALSIKERQFGSEHAATAEIWHALATLSHAQGKQVQAQERYQRALAIRERALGPDHPKTVETRMMYFLFSQTRDREASC